VSRFVRLLVVLLAMASVVVACGDSSSTPAVPGMVVVKDNLFTPKSATVKVGDTVTWTFKGNSAHNVTFDDFHSNLMKDGTYQQAFDTAGSFSYRCTVHPGMKGTIVVSNSAAP